MARVKPNFKSECKPAVIEPSPKGKVIAIIKVVKGPPLPHHKRSHNYNWYLSDEITNPKSKAGVYFYVDTLDAKLITDGKIFYEVGRCIGGGLKFPTVQDDICMVLRNSIISQIDVDAALEAIAEWTVEQGLASASQSIR